jgi:hypothetical protein
MSKIRKALVAAATAAVGAAVDAVASGGIKGVNVAVIVAAAAVAFGAVWRVPNAPAA